MSETIYRPGLEGVVAGETDISTVQGGLSYRGYRIEDLAAHAKFEETAYLLLYGELPNREQLAEFTGELARVQVDPAVLQCLGQLPRQGSMMDCMRTSVSLLSHWDPDVADNSPAANLRKSVRLLAQLPVAMAAGWRFRQDQPPLAPVAERSLAENVLGMLHDRQPTPEQARALDVTLTLYAEHEFNASTFTARVVSSTLSDLHSAVAAAVGALKGPLHGGANERVMEVLHSVGGPERAESWVRDALARKERIMGFGHRVYKQGDPRAEYLKPLCAAVAQQTGHDDLEATAATIERVVRDEKGLPPNLDWPSARLYFYLGLPIELYTPLFVVSRVTGWCAHVMEQLANNRLIRPRARYTGPPPRPWLALDAR